MFEQIWDAAIESGNKALLACKPTPVGFYQADLDDKPLGPVEIVNEGNCGGAYIILHDSRSEFLKWCKKNKKSVDKNIGKGYTLSVTEAHSSYNGQSAERYEACANAFAEV